MYHITVNIPNIMITSTVLPLKILQITGGSRTYAKQRMVLLDPIEN